MHSVKSDTSFLSAYFFWSSVCEVGRVGGEGNRHDDTGKDAQSVFVFYEWGENITGLGTC